MRIYLSFLLLIVFIACGGGGIPADKFDTIHREGASFTVKKGDSIISKVSKAQIRVIRNMSNDESSITVISGSVSFLNDK